MGSPKIHVIFRACDVVNAVNKQPRPFNFSKSDIIKTCFKSLYNSIYSKPHTITVLGDKLSTGMLQFFSGYNVKLSNGDYGNDESIRKSLELALQFTNDEDWIYFCEDDYLHRKQTFDFIYNLIAEKEKIIPRKLKKGFFPFSKIQKNPNIAIFPSDYPDRYMENDRAQHFIFVTKDCHWRQVANTTFTFLMQLKDVKKFKEVILKSTYKADDAFLSSSIFGKTSFENKLLCLSPLPSLTAHLHVDTLPPLIDWHKIALEINQHN